MSNKHNVTKNVTKEDMLFFLNDIKSKLNSEKYTEIAVEYIEKTIEIVEKYYENENNKNSIQLLGNELCKKFGIKIKPTNIKNFSGILKS